MHATIVKVYAVRDELWLMFLWRCRCADTQMVGWELKTRLNDVAIDAISAKQRRDQDQIGIFMLRNWGTLCILYIGSLLQYCYTVS